MKFNFVIVAILAGLMFCYQTVYAEVIDRVVAKVNDSMITLSEVRERAQLFKLQAKQMKMEKSFLDEEFEKRALDSILEEKLLLLEGKNLQMEVEEERVKQAIEDIKKQNNVNDEVLNEMLKRDGMSLEQYKNKIRDQILISQVRRFQMRGRVNVTKRQLRQYYRAHLKEFMESPRIHVRHILFLIDSTLSPIKKDAKKKIAENVLRQIKEGSDFTAMAKLYSEDESASLGGDLGVLERGKMVKEFEEAAFQLLPGEVSSVIETPYGLHIVKVDKIIPSKAKPFDEVNSQIEQILYEQEGAKKYKDWIDELKRKAFVENSLFQENKSTRSTVGRTARLSKKKMSPKKIDLFKPKELRPSAKNLSDSRSPAVPSSNKTLSKRGWDVEEMEKQLRYLKILQKRQIINDQEYERRKQEVFKQY